MYQLAEYGVIRLDDNLFIPEDSSNPDWIAYQQWLKEGNVPSPVPMNMITPMTVDIERNRRIDSGFVFNGVRYQSRAEDRENISGAALSAFMTIVNGNTWNPDFVWIAEDNTRVPMDAQTVIDFANTAASWKERHIFAASDLKAMDPIPDDYADDGYWPSAD